MNKWVKKSISLAMLTSLASINFCTVSIHAEAVNYIKVNEDLISLEKAKELAISHAICVAQTDYSCIWNQGFYVNSAKVLFDLDESISAYLIRFNLQDGTDAGYVVINSNKNEYPIVEYAISGKCFLDIAIEESKDLAEDDTNQTIQKNSSKIYYLGGQTYIAQHKLKNKKNVTYDISSEQIKKISKTNLLQEFNDDTYTTQQEVQNRDSTYKALEDTYKLNDYPCTDTPPDKKNAFITNPSSYESGYTSCNEKNISNYNLTYTTVYDYPVRNECSPVSMTNFMKWYRTFNRKKYNSLLYKSWKDTFYKLYDLMKTNDPESGGTRWCDLSAGVQTYLRSRGFKNAVASIKDTCPKDVIKMLDSNRPVALSVVENKCYGTHSILAVGYQDYMYKNGKHSKYIRIADGMSNKANRFLWWYTSGTMKYCYINFK